MRGRKNISRRSFTLLNKIIMNFNISRSGVKTLITNNPKTVFWSGVGTLVLTVISVRGTIWLYKHKKKCDTESDMAKTINEGAVAIKKMQVDTDSYLVKAIQDGEIAIRKKRNDTECDILDTAAQTACKMMEQATAITPELKGLKVEILAVKDEFKAMKEQLEKVNKPTPTGSDSESVAGSDVDCKGHSSADLFNRPREDNSKWVVDGYMKVDQVNLVVAGGGVGKTNVMVQIALAVAKGTRPEFLPTDCSASVMLNVVYYRLEDFSDELEGKYGDGKVLCDSGIKWFLPEDLPSLTLGGFTEHLKTLAATLTEDTLVCIDPATKLDGYKHTEFVKGVEEAKAIAKSRNITMTPVASIHLDEIKDWTVLTNCDIKGGDKGLQQAGSVTAVRRERTDVEKYRFLQSLKEPKGSPKPFNGDVLVMKKVHEQLDGNNKYLHYEFDSIKPEVMARPEKPKLQNNTPLPSKNLQSGRTGNNQTLFEEDDLLLKQWEEEGLPRKEMIRRLKKMGKDVKPKTISRHLEKIHRSESENGQD